jgi:hypothetical protein
MGTGGTMTGFPTDNFSATGGAGMMTGIGKGKELGASRAITLDHSKRDKY